MGTYTVEHLAADGTATDITEYVQEVGPTHLYSDGRVSTSALTLRASFGQFITDSRSGATPIISPFDRIRLTYTDDDSRSYSHIFLVENDMGQRTKHAQYLLPLTLVGREKNLQYVPFSGYFDPPLGHHTMINEIISAYLGMYDSSGQPQIQLVEPFIPDFALNFWDFQYIDNCLDAVLQVLRSANLGVANGGVGDRFGMLYEDDTTLLNKLCIRIISQGGRNAGGPHITLRDDPVHYPIQSVAKIRQPETGTVIIARGRPGSGGTPRQFDVYRARLEFYRGTPEYEITTQYKAGALVQYGAQSTNPELSPLGQIYRATQDTQGNAPTDTAYWETHSAEDYIGDFQYSPFTHKKDGAFRNECTNPGANFASDSEDSPKMLDYNISIRDVETYRDVVHIRSNTDTVSDISTDRKRYLFNGTSFYNGFTMLVDTGLGAAAGSFAADLDRWGGGAGNDPHGNPYADNMVIYTGLAVAEDGQPPVPRWVVIREHEDFDQCVVRHEGLFEYNTDFPAKSRYPANDTGNPYRRYRVAPDTSPAPVANGWRMLDGQLFMNDCLHSPTSISRASGLIGSVKKGTGNYTDNSAVEIVYQHGVAAGTETWRKVMEQVVGFASGFLGIVGGFFANVVATTLDLFLTPNYRNAGWWITWTAPWPLNTFNGIEEEVGELYGGGPDDVPAGSLRRLNNHPYFDALNQRRDFHGFVGWNRANSEDMGEITGVKFIFKFDIRNDSGRIQFDGDIPFAFWARDSDGNMWKSTQKYRHLGDPQTFTIDFGSFTPIYRARSPFGISTVVTNILVPELEIRERLFPNRITMMGFQAELSYDEHGRYNPILLERIIKSTITDVFSSPSVIRYIGTIDGLQWVTTPMAREDGSSLGIATARNIFPEFRDYPNISNRAQLKRAASADFVTENFRYEQYTIVQDDIADLRLQDTVFLNDDGLIPDADQTIAKTNDWESGEAYIPGNIVNHTNEIWRCIQAHRSGTTNAPPDADYWESLGGTAVPHTRELTVGEITLSVTNGRNWRRETTLIRRIPRVE